MPKELPLPPGSPKPLSSFKPISVSKLPNLGHPQPAPANAAPAPAETESPAPAVVTALSAEQPPANKPPRRRAPAASLPPPSPEEVAAAKKKKLVAAYVTLAIFVISAAVRVWQMIPPSPSSGAILDYLSKDVTRGAASFTSLSKDVTKLGDNDVRIDGVATGQLVEPLFEPMPDAAAKSQFGYDADKQAKATAILAGPLAKRVQELSQLDGLASFNFKGLRLATPAGEKLVYHVVLEAMRAGGQWTFRRIETNVTSGRTNGQPRSAYFPDKTFNVDDPAEQKLAQVAVADINGRADKILAAATVAKAEVEADKQRRLAALLDNFKPLSLFVGTLTNSQGNARLSLEVAEIRPAQHTIRFRLRNDGGWADSRGFQGTMTVDDDVTAIALKLQTRGDQTVSGAGPYVDDAWGWSIALQGDGKVLDGRRSDAVTGDVYHFERVADSDLAQAKDELMANQLAAVSASKAGLLYSGVAIAKRSEKSMPVLLRFVRQDKDGALLAAEWLTPDHPNWHRRLNGTIVANRYRGGDYPIRLKSSAEDRVMPAAGDSVLGYSGDLAPHFHLDGDRLTGEDNVFRYEMDKVATDTMSQLAKDEVAKEDQLLLAIKPASAFEGYVQAADKTLSSRVRLEFRRLERRGTLVEATLVAIDEGERRTLDGSFDPASGTLSLSARRGDTIRNSASAFFRESGLSGDNGTKFELIVHDNVVEGSVAHWTMSLTNGSVPRVAKDADKAPNANSQSAASTSGQYLASPSRANDTGGQVGEPNGLPPYPATLGAYVLAGDHWQPLPRNGGHVTYGAAQVLGTAVGLFGALSGHTPNQEDKTRADKLADLTFSGPDVVDPVDGQRLVLLYVGAIRPPPANLVQEYPELKKYPLMEMAATHRTTDGKRKVDLVRIVPGLAGFRDARVPATITVSHPGYTCLTCDSPTAIGSYAVTVNDESYELAVR